MCKDHRNCHLVSSKLPKDARLASLGFVMYFVSSFKTCKNIFYRRYCILSVIFHVSMPDYFSHADSVQQPLFRTFQPCGQYTAAPVQTVSAMQTVYTMWTVYSSPCSERFNHADRIRQPPIHTVSAMRTVYGSPCSDRFSQADRIRQPLFRPFQPCGQYTAAPVQTVSAMQTICHILHRFDLSYMTHHSPPILGKSSNVENGYYQYIWACFNKWPVQR